MESTNSSHGSHIIDATTPALINVQTENNNGDSNSKAQSTEEEQQWVTPMEAAQMSKARTLCTCKSGAPLEQAMVNRKPTAAVVVKSTTSKAAETHADFKSGRGKHGWSRVEFDDNEGLEKCGMCHSPMRLEESSMRAPKTFKHLQKLAKMAAVAVPLRFALGDNHDDSGKCCVVTNGGENGTSLAIVPFPL